MSDHATLELKRDDGDMRRAILERMEPTASTPEAL
ncbi:hypothetical protein PENVUL_c060G02766, partial [Penicillium vulpinum]